MTAFRCLALVSASLAAFAADVTLAADRPEALKNHRADPDARISSKNVDRLREAWAVTAESFVSHEPLLHKGSVYSADWAGNVYKIDAASGEVVWKKKVEKPKTQWPWHGFAGTGAIGEGLLFEASVEGNAFGINLETGEVKWQTRIAEDAQAGNAGRLLYYDGLVYVGLSSVEEPLTAKKEGFKPNFQGKVLALDAESGRTVWRLLLAKPPHNGAGVWSGFAVDPEADVLFITTSNNYTGDANEFSDAMIAVRAKTGELLWVKQVTEHDVWTKAHPIGSDYAFGAAPQLFEAVIDGRPRELVGAGQKSGVFWAFDRQTGDLVWATVVGYGGVGGGMHADAAIADGTIFAWSNNGYSYGKPPQKFPLSVKALDAATGKPLWAVQKAQPAAVPSAGFLASDVYFVGSLDGKIRGYDAATGKTLWTSPDAGGPIGTSLLVDDGMLLFGTGLPKNFSGVEQGRNAIIAYALRE